MVHNLTQWKKDHDLSGRKFGKLTVRKFLYFKFQNKTDGNVSVFLCDCKCGGTKKVARHLLLKGKTKSCGCIKTVKYKTDEKYFEKINTQDKAYFLGLMLTDGYSNERIKIFGIKLSPVDIHILKAFKKYLKTDRPIKIRKDKKYKYGKKILKPRLSAVIEVGIRKMVRDIVKLGVRQNKSKTVKFPNNNIVPHSLMHHLIRGIYDGDGTVGSDGKPAIISASIKFLNGIQKYLNKYNIKNTSILKYDYVDDDTGKQVKFNRLEINLLLKKGSKKYNFSKKTGQFLKLKDNQKALNAKRFFKMIYKNCSNDLFLKRKKEKVIKYLF